MVFSNRPHYRSEFGAAMSLSVACMGAGVLALPSGFAQAGILFAIATLLLVGYLTVVSLRYLVEVKEAMELHSYDAMSRELLGPLAEKAMQWIIIWTCIGANMGYVIIMGNILEPFKSDLARITKVKSFETNPLFPQQVYWALVLLPLSCIRNIKALSSSNTLAIAAAFVVSFMVIFRYFVPQHVHITSSPELLFQGHQLEQPAGGGGKLFHGNLVWLNVSPTAMIAVAILTFAMDCQTIVFQIYTQLKRPSLGAITRVSMLAVLIASSVYGAVGLFGYLSWRDAVNDNILLNYNPKEDWLAMIAYILYAIPVSMAYALWCLPVKDMIFSMYFKVKVGEVDRVPSRIFYPVSISISIFQMFAALYFPSIAVLVALLGGLFSSLVCFIFPAAFVLKMHYKKIKRARSKFDLMQKWFLFGFGVFAMVLGTYASLAQVFHPEHPSAGVHSPTLKAAGIKTTPSR